MNLRLLKVRSLEWMIGLRCVQFLGSEDRLGGEALLHAETTTGRTGR